MTTWLLAGASGFLGTALRVRLATDGDEVVRLAPALAEREPSAAYLFFDCQTDDVRLVLTVLGEAERFGTVMANRCEVTGLIDEGGRADGVRVRDAMSGNEIEIRADNVVNATGVWADTIRPSSWVMTVRAITR